MAMMVVCLGLLTISSTAMLAHKDDEIRNDYNWYSNVSYGFGFLLMYSFCQYLYAVVM